MTGRPDPHACDWEQLRLFREPVVEVHLRLGYAPLADHFQWQYELRSPVTGELLAMRSVWHTPSRERFRAAELAIAYALADLEAHVEPFEGAYSPQDVMPPAGDGMTPPVTGDL